jgi:hypothetical protein
VAQTAKKGKRKRQEDKGEDREAKKAKVERIAPAKAVKDDKSPPPRIFEIEDDSDEAMSLY